MSGSPQRVCLGIVTAPHGVRGMVRVKSFTAEPEALARYSPIENETGERIELDVVGARQGRAAGGDRRRSGPRRGGAAERHKALSAARPAAAARGRGILPRRPPRPRSRARRRHGAGRVAAIHDYGAGATIEIAPQSGAPILVPFTRATVPVVDIAAGRIVVVPPGGLFDPASPEEREEA